MNFKFNPFLLAIFFSLVVQAQQSKTVLTKIERSVNVGDTFDYFDASLAPFYHGVASGDPLEDAVIIWTRVTTNQLSVDVNWRIATDMTMNNIVNQGSVTTTQDQDYTVKVDAKNLNPYTTYYFQFEALGATSVIGKTKTAPAQEDIVDNLRFAIVSCSNYQDGYFNVYNQIANRSDLDAVIHLGDYIYEYESGGYGYSQEIGRGHVPENEIITLDDYRVRHSFYKLDPMLRNVHQQHPFINIWDDHEFANDANKFGAENHTEATEGDWETRKNNAFKAYFEWMPVRANTIEEYRLYRTISYGKLMDLIMLDTRIEGRYTQVTTSKNLISAASSNDEFKSFAQNVIAKKNLKNESELREVLEAVLPMVLRVSSEEKIAEGTLSSKEFDIVVDEFTKLVQNANTSKVSTSSDTGELERLLRKGTRYNLETEKKSSKATYNSILGAEQFAWLKEELQASSAKWRVIGNQVMLMPWNGVPTNDAWDGYQEEREVLLEFVDTNDINNIIVLTGDIHSTFIGEVEYEGDCKMCEFIVPSVTSTNLDFLGGVVSGLSQFYIRLLNRHIKDVDLDNHGYYVLDVREDRVQGDWYDINTIEAPVSGEQRSRSWYVNIDDCQVRSTSIPAVAEVSTRAAGLDATIGNTGMINKDDFTIMGLYPMPLQNLGNIHYIVHQNTTMKISIYDLSGKKIRELQNERMVPGIYNLSFDSTTISSGNYVVAIETDNTRISRNIVVK